MAFCNPTALHSNLSGDQVPLSRRCGFSRARPSNSCATRCVKGGTHPTFVCLLERFINLRKQILNTLQDTCLNCYLWCRGFQELERGTDALSRIPCADLELLDRF